MENFDKIDLLITMFKTAYMLEKEYVDFSEDYVENKTKKILESVAPNVLLSEEEYSKLLANIYSEFEVHQEEGVALFSNYEHIRDWYNPNEISNKFFWNRYKRWLNETTDIKVDDLENIILNKMMQFLGDPRTENNYRRRGLIIGDVQSGKTATYIGLISKAVDAGYKLIILLSGTIESLRKQTQKRVEEGFIGYDTFARERVGVGKYSSNEKDITPFSLTSTDNDFTGIMDRTTVLQNLEGNTPVIFVIKKNSVVLNKLYEGLKVARRGKKISAPMVLIDDEADNASINTNKNDNPTKINESIRKILSLFEKSNYVGFTATPFANVFIDPESEEEMLGSDLFPEDFIYAIFPPDNYIGAKQYFINQNNKNVVRIIDDDPNFLKHNKGWRGRFPFNSFYDSIIAFFLANVIRDYRKDNEKHRTMLINVSRFSNVHYEIQKSVDLFLKDLKAAIVLNVYKTEKEMLLNDTIYRIYTVWEEQYKDEIQWKDVVSLIEKSTSNIYTVVINSTSRNKLSYTNKNSERVIAIGGIALSRGLTLEGLVVSYFYRNTCTFDVLMQMGRWFGYRKGYEDLCRVYIPPKSESWYREIAESIETLKQDMKKMALRDLAPKDFGIRVRNDSKELGITSRSKSRSTRKRDGREDFYGNVFEAPYISENVMQNQIHITALNEFAGKLNNKDLNIKHPYYRDIEKNIVLGFLRNLKFSLLNNNFDLSQIVTFFVDSDFKYFDILFMEGDSKIEYQLTKNVSIKLVSRTFDVILDKIENGKEIIRVNGQRTRVGGTADTKIGLSKEQINRLKSDENLIQSSLNNSKLYMLDDRNPLLIIYIIELNNDSRTEYEKNIANKYNNTENPLVTFAIGIPNRNPRQLLITENSNGHTYVVPYKYDYYNLYGKEVEKEFEDSRDVEI